MLWVENFRERHPDYIPDTPDISYHYVPLCITRFSPDGLFGNSCYDAMYRCADVQKFCTKNRSSDASCQAAATPRHLRRTCAATPHGSDSRRKGRAHWAKRTVDSVDCHPFISLPSLSSSERFWKATVLKQFWNMQVNETTIQILQHMLLQLWTRLQSSYVFSKSSARHRVKPAQTLAAGASGDGLRHIFLVSFKKNPINFHDAILCYVLFVQGLPSSTYLNISQQCYHMWPLRFAWDWRLNQIRRGCGRFSLCHLRLHWRQAPQRLENQLRQMTQHDRKHVGDKGCVMLRLSFVLHHDTTTLWIVSRPNHQSLGRHWKLLRWRLCYLHRVKSHFHLRNLPGWNVGGSKWAKSSVPEAPHTPWLHGPCQSMSVHVSPLTQCMFVRVSIQRVSKLPSSGHMKQCKERM